MSRKTLPTLMVVGSDAYGNCLNVVNIVPGTASSCINYVQYDEMVCSIRRGYEVPGKSHLKYQGGCAI